MERPLRCRPGSLDDTLVTPASPGRPVETTRHGIPSSDDCSIPAGPRRHRRSAVRVTPGNRQSAPPAPGRPGDPRPAGDHRRAGTERQPADPDGPDRRHRAVRRGPAEQGRGHPGAARGADPRAGGHPRAHQRAGPDRVGGLRLGDQGRRRGRRHDADRHAAELPAADADRAGAGRQEGRGPRPMPGGRRILGRQRARPTWTICRSCSRPGCSASSASCRTPGCRSSRR